MSVYNGLFKEAQECIDEFLRKLESLELRKDQALALYHVQLLKLRSGDKGTGDTNRPTEQTDVVI